MEPLLPVLGIHTCPIIVGGRVRKASAHMAVKGAFSLPPIGSTAAQLVVMQPTKLLVSFIFASLVLEILTSSAKAEQICSMEGSTLASTVLEWWSAEDSDDQLVLLLSDRSGREVWHVLHRSMGEAKTERAHR